MNNFNRPLILRKNRPLNIFSRLLLSAIITISGSVCSGIKVMAQENLDSPTQNRDTEENSKPISVSKTRNQNSILEAIWQLLRAKREREPALSSRSNICEISPGLLGEVNIIYSDRPLFLWQGIVTHAQINLYTPFSLDKEQEIFWSQAVMEKSPKVLYRGEALQPGQIYDWEIIVNPQSNRRRISFQVMDEKKRDRISRQLKQLESELAISGATATEIALERANYFAQQDLWSDAIQEIFSLENSGTAFNRKAQEIIKYLC